MSAPPPLTGFQNWTPFRIDALGLVTLLGAEEVDRYYGQLVRNCLVDWLPQLGSHIVASTKFREPIAGFQLYNIDQGIMTGELTPWLARWLLAQDFEKSISVVTWNILPKHKPRKKHGQAILGIAIGGLVSAGLITLPALQEDWWGLANSIAMVASVFVRQTLLRITSGELDKAVDTAVDDVKKAAKATMPLVTRDSDLRASMHEKQCHSLEAGNATVHEARPGSLESERFRDDYINADGIEMKLVELFCVLPSGQGLTMRAPNSVVRRCFTAPKLEMERTIMITKGFGWLYLGVLLVSIGQATLLTQIPSVVVMVLSTLCATFKIGCDDRYVGTRLFAHRDKDEEKHLIDFFETDQYHPDKTQRRSRQPDGGRRMVAYARLRAARTDEGQKSMEAWHLLPHKHIPEAQEKWFKQFEETKTELENHWRPSWMKKRRTTMEPVERSQTV